MPSPLFREEAVTQAHRRLEGSVLIATPLSSKVLTGVLASVFLIAAVFLSTASYARKETVQGWIVPSSGFARLIARQGGQVESLSVREGDTVRKGQTLAMVLPGAGIVGTASKTASPTDSPIDGVVLALPAEPGQVIQPNGTVAIVTPPDTALSVELFAPTRAVGFIKPGQSVRLMYDAFPFQSFGAGTGRVIAVSRLNVGMGDVAMPGFRPTEPFYSVKVAIDKAAVSAYGQAMPLQAGMTLKADVLLERRSLFEWLFDPLYAAGRRA